MNPERDKIDQLIRRSKIQALVFLVGLLITLIISGALYVQNIQLRNELAHNYNILETQSIELEEARDRFINLFTICNGGSTVDDDAQKVKTDNPEEVSSIEPELKRLDLEINKLEEEKNKSITPNETQVKIDAAKRKQDSLLSSSQVLIELKSSVDSLEKNVKKFESQGQKAPVVPNDSTQGLSPPNPNLTSESSKLNVNSWFKEGFYRNYGKIRIGLNKVGNPAKIRFSEILDQDSLRQIELVAISKGASYTITLDGEDYVFTYVTKGAAGKNPFTKAVFFNFRKK